MFKYVKQFGVFVVHRLKLHVLVTAFVQSYLLSGSTSQNIKIIFVFVYDRRGWFETFQLLVYLYRRLYY